MLVRLQQFNGITNLWIGFGEELREWPKDEKMHTPEPDSESFNYSTCQRSVRANEIINSRTKITHEESCELLYRGGQTKWSPLLSSYFIMNNGYFQTPLQSTSATDLLLSTSSLCTCSSLISDRIKPTQCTAVSLTGRPNCWPHN